MQVATRLVMQRLAADAGGRRSLVEGAYSAASTSTFPKIRGASATMLCPDSNASPLQKSNQHSGPAG